MPGCILRQGLWERFPLGMYEILSLFLRFCYFYSSFLKCVLLPIPPRIFPGFVLQFLFTKQHGWYLKLSLCVHNCGSGLD